MRCYAIGDIHGHLDKLVAVHDRIARDRSVTGDHSAPVVHLGDYADRGPDVPGVLNFLINGLNRGEPWVTLRGNHDRLMWHFLQETEQRDTFRPDLHWLAKPLGGRATLAAYGVDVAEDRPVELIHRQARAAVPEGHLTFLSGLENSVQIGGAYFCHAGIRPGVPLQDQIEDDLIWIRREFLDDTRDHGALIVHGHTPADAITHMGNRLNLDTGAGYGRALSVVVIEEGAVFELTPEGRVPVAAEF